MPRRRTRRPAAHYPPAGAVAHNGYWDEDYTVLAHNPDGTITIRWHGKDDSLGLDRFPAGRTGTHRTPFDRRGGDYIISTP